MLNVDYQPNGIPTAQPITLTVQDKFGCSQVIILGGLRKDQDLAARFLEAMIQFKGHLPANDEVMEQIDKCLALANLFLARTAEPPKQDAEQKPQPKIAIAG